MAIADYEITTADKNAVRVTSQPTVLRGTALQNKQVFDNYCDMIVTHFNGLVGELGNQSDTVIDSEVLALYTALGWVAD